MKAISIKHCCLMTLLCAFCIAPVYGLQTFPKTASEDREHIMSEAKYGMTRFSKKLTRILMPTEKPMP